MQGVEPDFGVDLASDFPHDRGFLEDIARFSGIQDGALDWEESLKDIEGVSIGQAVAVCRDVDREAIPYVVLEWQGWPGISFEGFIDIDFSRCEEAVLWW